MDAESLIAALKKTEYPLTTKQARAAVRAICEVLGLTGEKWWKPVLVDGAYFARLRMDYPEDALLSDEALHHHYANGLKYALTWDHVGDAYEEYERLADALLALLTAAGIDRCSQEDR